MATNPDALVNIKGEEGAPDSVYCAMLKIEIDNGICELPVGSFCIAMGPDSARWGKKLNGFDVWLGTGQDPSSGDCELAYSADNLVTLGLWETSPDGKYCYFEADFSKPFAAGYAVLALTKDNLLTTHESLIPGSAPEEKTLYSFLLGEFAVFGKTLDGKDLYEEMNS